MFPKEILSTWIQYGRVSVSCSTMLPMQFFLFFPHWSSKEDLYFLLSKMRSLVCDATDSIDLYKTIFLMEAPAFSLLSADTDIPQLVVGTGTIYYSESMPGSSMHFLWRSGMLACFSHATWRRLRLPEVDYRPDHIGDPTHRSPIPFSCILTKELTIHMCLRRLGKLH